MNQDILERALYCYIESLERQLETQKVSVLNASEGLTRIWLLLFPDFPSEALDGDTYADRIIAELDRRGIKARV